MAVMPGARYAPIDYAGVPEMVRWDVVCFHTIVGHDPAPAAHFSVGSEGELTQSRDTEYQSAANWRGNPRVIAVETEDRGEPFPTWVGGDVPAWTDAQCETNARIAAWAHKEHGVPLVRCPDSKPTSRGIGWHRLGITGNFTAKDYPGRVDGGELWTKSPGKECPGNRRIWQVINVVIPRARVLAGLDPAPVVVLPPEEVPDMERILVVWGKKPTDAAGYASLCGLVLPGPDGRVFEDISAKPKSRTDADRNAKRTDAGRWDEVTVEADVWDRYRARFEPAEGGA